VTKAVAELARAEDGPGFDPYWGKKKDGPNKPTPHPARTELLKTDLGDAHYHSVNFEGLAPKTKYVYRVGDGTRWSEWYQFETASEKPEPFGFIYFGDAQNGIKSLWSRVARGAYSDMPKAKFIIHAGDLVDRGSSDADWGEWHAAAGWINGMVPSVPTPGNHEYSGPTGLTEHWRAQFTVPEHGPAGLYETVYYLDYQGVRVISLNTEEKLAEQAAWLEGVLKENPNRWTVVTFHRPVYSSSRGRDNPKVREAWRPLFDTYNVDLVLQGHDHSYARSGRMRDDNVLGGLSPRAEHGTVYVVSVSGAKMYEVGDLSWAASKAQDVQLYQLVRVDGDRLSYESRTATGDLFDSFELRKRPGSGNTLVNTGGRRDPGRRDAWNAAAAVLVLALVGLGVGWAIRRR
jgi:3',5'-cyclic AMP phosphodiesterase CpdA